MSSLGDLVFANTDHFRDAQDEKTGGKDAAAGRGYVHIRIQQRNGRKSLTTVQGLASDLDLKKILKALKKVGTTSDVLSDKREVCVFIFESHL